MKSDFEYLEMAQKMGTIRIYNDRDELVIFTNEWVLIAKILRLIDKDKNDVSLVEK